MSSNDMHFKIEFEDEIYVYNPCDVENFCKTCKRKPEFGIMPTRGHHCGCENKEDRNWIEVSVIRKLCN